MKRDECEQHVGERVEYAVRGRDGRLRIREEGVISTVRKDEVFVRFRGPEGELVNPAYLRLV